MTDRSAKIAPHVYAREFDGELVLLDIGKGEYFGLDAVGARIWASISEGLTVDAIATRVSAEFEVEAEVARKDVDALLSEMRTHGLIEIGE